MGLTCVVSAPLLLQLACLQCTSLLQAYQPTSSPIKDSTAGMNLGNQMAVTLLLGSSAFELLLSLLLAYVETVQLSGIFGCMLCCWALNDAMSGSFVAGAFALLSPADTSFGCLGILRDLPVWRRGTCCLVVLFASHLIARPLSQLLVEAYDAVFLGYSVLSSLPPYTFVIVLDVEYFCPFNAYRDSLLGKWG